MTLLNVVWIVGVVMLYIGACTMAALGGIWLANKMHGGR